MLRLMSDHKCVHQPGYVDLPKIALVSLAAVPDASHYRLCYVTCLNRTLQGRCRGSGSHYLLGTAGHEAGMDHARRDHDNADLGSGPRASRVSRRSPPARPRQSSRDRAFDLEEQEDNPTGPWQRIGTGKPPVNAPPIAGGETMLLVPAIPSIESGPNILPMPFAVSPTLENRAPSRTP
jgi:hypothetical protein